MCSLSESRIKRIKGLHGGRNCLNQDTKDLQDKGREAEKARDRKARQFIGVSSD